MESHELLARLERDGFLMLRRYCVDAQVRDLALRCRSLVASAGGRPAGLRNLLAEDPIIAQLCHSMEFLSLAQAILGPEARAVRVILFDKSAEANWGVPWHQDLNIAVRGGSTPPGYGARTVKQGVPHIVPPQAVLESMITLRLHLDPCGVEDGPLEVAPGSHQLGVLSPSPDDLARWESAAVVCLADPGDVLLMRPLLFHRSLKAKDPNGRLVLHVEYAAASLAGDLQWFFEDSGAPCSGLSFTWDSFFWIASVKHPSWAGFLVAGGNAPDPTATITSDGSLKICYAPEGRDESPLKPEERASVQWVVDHLSEICEAALASLLHAYPRIREEYASLLGESDLLAILPPVTRTEDLKPLLEVTDINVHQVAVGGIPFVGVCFNCAWDPEHGVGILLHGTRAVEIGDTSTASMLWVAEEHAKGF